jgi:NADH-quinone oxidoreductase subunit C
MRTNSIAPGAPYLNNEALVMARLTEKYLPERKIETDKLGEVIIWAKNADDAKLLVRSFMIDKNTKVDFLSDLTAYDNQDQEDGEKRFVVVYQLYSTELHTRIRVKVLIDENEEAVTITDVFTGANWLEREVFDMFGIKFKGHPNMRRILMDERFTGHPLRKEYPIKQREPFADNVRLHLGGNDLHVETNNKA